MLTKTNKEYGLKGRIILNLKINYPFITAIRITRATSFPVHNLISLQNSKKE